MSTAGPAQEMPALEEANPCRFVVLTEDAATHDAAMEICGRVLARFDAELGFHFSFWKLGDLEAPGPAHWAAEAVVHADILLVSLQGHDLTPGTMNWMESCIHARSKTQGALALFVTEPSAANPTLKALLGRMQFAATRLRMDFLPLFPLPEGANIETVVVPPLELLNNAREDPDNNHWGLNE